MHALWHARMGQQPHHRVTLVGIARVLLELVQHVGMASPVIVAHWIGEWFHEQREGGKSIEEREHKLEGGSASS